MLKKNKGRVVFPENQNPKILKAIEYLEKENLAEIVSLNDEKIDTVYEDIIIANRPQIRRKLASRIIKKPLYLSGCMLALGKADVMVAGIETPTRRIIEASAITLGYADNTKMASSFFLMIFEDGREMVFSDCALNVKIDSNILVNIAVNASRNAKTILGDSKIAMLSYSTLTSGQGSSVSMVKDATDQLLKLKYKVQGPIQVDAALSETVSKTKGIKNGGDSNVFIFPSLDAGNIAYKLCQELAGARAIGPILEGFKKPVCDLSRGASVEDIINATLISLLLNNN